MSSWSAVRILVISILSVSGAAGVCYIVSDPTYAFDGIVHTLTQAGKDSSYALQRLGWTWWKWWL